MKSKSSKRPQAASARKSKPAPAADSPRRGSRTLKKINFPIVGIGASAGGLEALTQLLRTLPPATGMAFVVVQHLDPTHESALSVLLARITAMPVIEATNNLKLKPNHVYVIPPNKCMGIGGGRLQLLPRRAGELPAPIDFFFHALAAESGSSAIGIILSGSGSDGTPGLQAIKAAGGITFAQDEKSAKYPAMPGSAAATGCVDFVLPPGEIAGELARLGGHPCVKPAETDDHGTRSPAEEKVFDEILVLLQQRIKVDLRQYKWATLERRMRRRMLLHRFATLREYARYLQAHPTEVQELFNDMLIHVTGFFRDPKIFQALRKRIFPRILKEKKAGEAIRVWVPGCSTGEEVYSIVMAWTEFLHDQKSGCPLQVFGTDISDGVLDRARAGIYPESALAHVSPERRRRFFIKHEGGYRISKSIRGLCVFARQNVLVDAPFSNVDMISCRNVLIYFGLTLQRKIMPVFNYALRPHGVLVLGASETIGGFVDLFTLVDKRAKIYLKKPSRNRGALAFGSVKHAPRFERAGLTADKPAEQTPLLPDVLRHADRIMLAHGPAGVIINQHMEVLQFRGRTAPFLEHAQGEASLNLLKLAREGLGTELRAVVSQAFKRNTRVRRDGVSFEQEGRMLGLNLEVVPFQPEHSRERFYLVLFDVRSTPDAKKSAGRKGSARSQTVTREVSQLRDELASRRESLQAIIQEREATNEELRSANEEILSSNEELQSTNEEMETTKEELQSTNEELTTLNEELETRNSEMESVNNDLHNVLASVNIPILILGREFQIRRFTALAEKLFNLIPSDVGRPLTDIASKVNIPEFPTLVLDVIETLTMKEMEICDKEGHWWNVRIRPYRTTDHKIDGAVISLMDIDGWKKGMQQAAQHRLLTETILGSVRQSLVVLDCHMVVRNATDMFLQMFQLSAAETIGHVLFGLVDGGWNVAELRHLLEDSLDGSKAIKGFPLEYDFPRIGRRSVLLEAHRVAVEGVDRDHLTLLSVEDVTGRN